MGIRDFFKSKNHRVADRSVLLGLMPFWSPLAPPLGISLLKADLRRNGFRVETVDLNVDMPLWSVQEEYFKLIRAVVPENRRGNFYMKAYDVLGNHLMAHLHKSPALESDYRRLIGELILKNYGVPADAALVGALDRVATGFYSLLRDRLLALFQRVKPDIFGLSVYSTTLGSSLFAFRLFKGLFPHAPTVMGGGVFSDHLAPESPNFREFLAKTESYIDTIIVGEGEVLFKKYLFGEFKHEKRVYQLSDIAGKGLDLSGVAAPDFSGLDLSSYFQMGVYASRSCPFQCDFCSETVQWGAFRKKKPRQVLEEITYIKKNYGGKLFMFGDSLVNPFINELSRTFIKERPDIYWDGYLRAGAGADNPDMVEMWRRGGFYRARLGIESGSPRVLGLMNKKLTPPQIKESLTTLSRFGIKTTTYWIVGFPGETESDFCETLELLAELKDYIYEADWHPFYFFPRGQVGSDRWLREKDPRLLYPDEFAPLLLAQTWVLGCDPGWDETMERMNRFAAACDSYGIPNPYSLRDIAAADSRWRRLHPGGGPPLANLHNYNHLVGKTTGTP